MPYQIPQEMKIEAIMDSMSMDKKAKSNEPEFVLLESLGKTKVFAGGKNAVKIKKDVLLTMLREFKDFE